MGKGKPPPPASNCDMRGQDHQAIGAFMRSVDWTKTALGPAASWPADLKSYVRLILGSAQPMFLAWGPERTWLYNDAFTPILAHKHPLALGRPSREVWSEAWHVIEPMFDRVFDGEPVRMDDLAIELNRHGSLAEAHFAFSYSPVTDESGRVCGLFGVCIETTDQVFALRAMRKAEDRLKRTSAKLRESDARLRALNASLARQVEEKVADRDRLWRNSQDLIVVVGPDGIIQAANPAWETVLGWTEQEIVGQHHLGFNHRDSHPGSEAALDTAVRGSLPPYESRMLHKDGSDRWVSWIAATEAGLVYASGRDITAERKAREALSSAQEALRQSQKMEAMGQLTGGVAHDFNNLLTPIIGSLDMLQRTRFGGEREGRLLAGAMHSAERARVLVHRLLAFARRQPLQAVSVDVAQLLKNIGDLVTRTIGPAIKVVVEAPDDLPAAMADPNQLEMALLNLSVNARDAMPDGGVLRICAAAEDVGEGDSKGLKAGKYIKFCVADTGLGMDESILAHAVEPFFSTKGVGKGTGLGLSMVHGLASQLGGSLHIQSQIGSGTKVEIWLPQSDLGPGRARPSQPLADERVRRGAALVVDDEEFVRLSAAEMLHELGFSVVEAASAEEAIGLTEKGVPVDLLVTDHLMPGMNGTDLMEEIRLRRPDAQMLLMSGYAEKGGIPESVPRLSKPFTKDELAAALARE